MFHSNSEVSSIQMAGAKLKLFTIDYSIFSHAVLKSYVLFLRNCIEFITNVQNGICFSSVSLNHKRFS